MRTILIVLKYEKVPFIEEILKCRSVSIIGMAKNTGKTEVLNYVLRQLACDSSLRLAVTSIGVDGERSDIVTQTAKPEITLCEGTMFGTAEEFYRRRRISAEIIDVSDERTPLGRVVTAVARSEGKAMLAGAGSTAGIKRWMGRAELLGANLTIVDGALSRKSLASPAVSEALILCTGAALSADMNTLVAKTIHTVKMIRLPLVADDLKKLFQPYDRGVWGADRGGNILCLSSESSLMLDGVDSNVRDECRTVYVAGALTDRFLDMFMNNTCVEDTLLVVDDFSKVFISENAYSRFRKRGGIINVMHIAKLIALCVNPVSPNGIVMDSETLCRRLFEAARIPVYDIFRL